VRRLAECLAECEEHDTHRLPTAQVVYPMHTQIQLLIDAAMVGARRVFDFEWLANDSASCTNYSSSHSRK